MIDGSARDDGDGLLEKSSAVARACALLAANNKHAQETMPTMAMQLLCIT